VRAGLRRGWKWAGGVAVMGAVMTACQERLTSPAECPELCPGGSAQVFDTTVIALQDRDSSFTGYVDRGAGPALLVSNGFAASDDRAIYRFAPRADSITVRDTLRAYTVDSAVIGLTLAARDTNVNGLKVYLYRLPPTVDSTATFDVVDPLLADPALIDSIAVPDSVNGGALQTVLRGTDVDRLGLPLGGDSVLAIGLRITAEAPTGIRVGSIAGGTAATFTTYVTVDVPDTGLVRNQSLNRASVFNTFVTRDPPQPSDSLLTVGGEPSSRALIRFDLSDAFLDSATIVRATLELVPTQPIVSLPTDPAILETRAVLGDIGAKSPLTTQPALVQQDTLPALQTDTVRVELTRVVQAWQASRVAPQSVFMLLRPEAASFTRAVFGSTRSPAVGAPRLRITYQRAFPFESP
jgi:hypothetical protein